MSNLLATLNNPIRPPSASPEHVLKENENENESAREYAATTV